MDATERLLERAREYELLAAWCSEPAGFSADATSAVAFTVAAILLREVAGALEEEPWAA